MSLIRISIWVEFYFVLCNLTYKYWLVSTFRINELTDENYLLFWNFISPKSFCYWLARVDEGITRMWSVEVKVLSFFSFKSTDFPHHQMLAASALCPFFLFKSHHPISCLLQICPLAIVKPITLIQELPIVKATTWHMRQFHHCMFTVALTMLTPSIIWFSYFLMMMRGFCPLMPGHLTVCLGMNTFHWSLVLVQALCMWLNKLNTSN